MAMPDVSYFNIGYKKVPVAVFGFGTEPQVSDLNSELPYFLR